MIKAYFERQAPQGWRAPRGGPRRPRGTTPRRCSGSSPHTATPHLLHRWEQVSGQDIQWWLVWLLARYSDSYASNQYRALQQFFKWWAGKEERPDPMARLQRPKVTGTLVPAFTRVELSQLERACQGRSFAQRRDAAVISV